MGFNLRVTFTGLVGLVRNADERAYPPGCVLLVDGRQPIRSLDGSILCRHRSFLRFPIDNVSGSSGILESLGLWYLDRQRLYFKVERAEGSDLGADLVLSQLELPDGSRHPEKPDVTNAAEAASLTWLLEMERLFPDAVLDERALQEVPPEEAGVVTQVVIDHGGLSTKTFTPAVWECGNHLSGELVPYRQVFAHEIALVIPGLTSAEVIAVGFDDPLQRRRLDLTSLVRDGEVEIQVINICENNPLQWQPGAAPSPDHDSKWYYELLHPEIKERLRRRLGPQELPIPVPVEPFEIGAPGSGNCIPIKLASTAFSLPRLGEE